MDSESEWGRMRKDSLFPPFSAPPNPPHPLVDLIGIMRWRLVGTKLLRGANGDIIILCVCVCVQEGVLAILTQAPLGY